MQNQSLNKVVLNRNFPGLKDDRKPMTCFNCGEIGHTSRVCLGQEYQQV